MTARGMYGPRGTRETMWVELSCLFCGGTFSRLRSEAGKSAVRFCSREHGQLHRRRMKERAAAQTRTLKCAGCGRGFKVPAAGPARRFCGRPCARRAWCWPEGRL